MTARRWLVAALVWAALDSTVEAQIYSPQSSARLTVSFTTERVVVSVEGLDDAGRVISRGRAYVFGVVPSRGSSPFEVRVSSPGSEKRWRVEIESFQYAASSGN
jgi:hypothetical protein